MVVWIFGYVGKESFSFDNFKLGGSPTLLKALALLSIVCIVSLELALLLGVSLGAQG